MKAYVTSIGEKTTEICCKQLQKYGFEVVLLDEKESWDSKYRRFIEIAEPPCIRIDADIVPNEKIIINKGKLSHDMVQYMVYDLYKNDLTAGNPMYYSEKAIEIIRENIDKIDMRRPEANAWRLLENTNTSDLIVGMHGFFQDEETMNRAEQHKKDRGHLERYKYDFKLARDLCNLNE